MIVDFDIYLLQLINGSCSSFWDAFMLTLTSGYTWIAVYMSLLYLILHNCDNMTKFFLMAGCAMLCIVLAGGISDLIVKPIVGRIRPVNTPELQDVVHSVKGYGSKDFSFFSSHAANTFSLTTFFTLLVRNRYMSIAMFIWAFTNCYTRLYLGVHYPSDVLVGILWGITTGTLAYLLYKRIHFAHLSKNNNSSMLCESNLFSVSSIDGVVLLIVVSYIYAIFRSLLTA